MTEKDLTPSVVIALRQGDPGAGEKLESLYRDRIVRFCGGYLNDAAGAEDAAQEVFLKVLEASSVPDRFRPWLFRVARNHCLNLLRTRGRSDEARLPTDPGFLLSQTGHLTRLVREEDRLRLAQALEGLPLEQREVLKLRYGEELPREEIAAVLELPVSVVKSRLFEGMKKLRERAARFG